MQPSVHGYRHPQQASQELNMGEMLIHRSGDDLCKAFEKAIALRAKEHLGNIGISIFDTKYEPRELPGITVGKIPEDVWDRCEDNQYNRIEKNPRTFTFGHLRIQIPIKMRRVTSVITPPR